MPSTDLFDGFRRFGDRILDGVDRDERPALKYKYLLGQINALLNTTHGMVVERLETIENATNPTEAKAAISEIRSDALEESFRIEGMCDVFEAFGNTLSQLAWQSQDRQDSVAPDLGGIQDFSQRLLDREREVATIYADQLTAIVNIGDVEGDLPGLRKRAAEAKKILTDQMADFAAKAKRFMSVSK